MRCLQKYLIWLIYWEWPKSAEGWKLYVLDRKLKEILDKHDNVNIFISEGAGVKDIVARMEAEGKEVQRDAFGHVKLDSINPGKYFADTFSGLIGAEKVLVQKSGYFARSAAANADDVELIRKSAEVAVAAACRREGGVVGLDEDADDVLRVCEFSRIKGGKAFDTSVPSAASKIVTASVLLPGVTTYRPLPWSYQHH